MEEPVMTNTEREEILDTVMRGFPRLLVRARCLGLRDPVLLTALRRIHWMITQRYREVRAKRYIA